MSQVTPGFHFNFPAQDYHKVHAVSSSQLKVLRKSPAHLMQYLMLPPDPTCNMRFGTLVHEALCAGGLDKLDIIIRPAALDGRSKAGKLWNDQHSHELHKCYSQDDVDAAKHILDKVLQDQELARCATGEHEVTLFSTLLHPDSQGNAHEVSVKARLDLIPPGDFLVDFKTTVDATPDKFAWTVWNLGYDIQVCHYLETYNSLVNDPQKRSKFLLVAIETDPPYEFRKYVLSERFIQVARQKWSSLLTAYVDSATSGIWSGYPRGIGVLEPPKWGDDRYLSEIL